MKNLLLLSCLLMISSGLFSQKNNDQMFNVKCVLKNFDKKLKTVELFVYKEGNLYEKLETTNGKFDLNLPMGGEFMFEFKEVNHFIKRIAFNTVVEGRVELIPILDLSILLIPKEMNYLAEDDLDLLDFPVAYIAFNSKKNEFFDINKNYSDILTKEIEQHSKSNLKVR